MYGAQALVGSCMSQDKGLWALRQHTMQSHCLGNIWWKRRQKWCDNIDSVFDLNQQLMEKSAVWCGMGRRYASH